MYFTLCIPTMDRYDVFLKNYLPKYIENSLINEIIITDENGNDIDKINNSNIDKTKLKLYKNNNRLGPFMNKLTACKYSSNEWIALIDSDNFADENYFKISRDYINTISNTNYDIISPSFAQPNFDYRHLNGKIINKQNLSDIVKYDHFNKGNKTGIETLMNTGNYILNKKLINEINLDNETQNIKYSSACDVIYFNTLLFEQFNLQFHIISDLSYIHNVHNDSIYMKTHHHFTDFNALIHNRFKSLYN